MVLSGLTATDPLIELGVLQPFILHPAALEVDQERVALSPATILSLLIEILPVGTVAEVYPEGTLVQSISLGPTPVVLHKAGRVLSGSRGVQIYRTELEVVHVCAYAMVGTKALHPATTNKLLASMYKKRLLIVRRMTSHYFVRQRTFELQPPPTAGGAYHSNSVTLPPPLLDHSPHRFGVGS